MYVCNDVYTALVFTIVLLRFVCIAFACPQVRPRLHQLVFPLSLRDAHVARIRDHKRQSICNAIFSRIASIAPCLLRHRRRHASSASAIACKVRRRQQRLIGESSFRNVSRERKNPDQHCSLKETPPKAQRQNASEFAPFAVDRILYSLSQPNHLW